MAHKYFESENLRMDDKKAEILVRGAISSVSDLLWLSDDIVNWFLGDMVKNGLAKDLIDLNAGLKKYLVDLKSMMKEEALEFKAAKPADLTWGQEMAYNLTQAVDLALAAAGMLSNHFGTEGDLSRAASEGLAALQAYKAGITPLLEIAEVVQYSKEDIKHEVLKQNVKFENAGEVDGKPKSRFTAEFMALEVDTFRGITKGIVIPAGDENRTFLTGEYFSKELIAELLIDWAINSPYVNKDHDQADLAPHWEHPDFRVFEFYQAPIDFVMGGEQIRQGDWLMSTIAISEQHKQDVKDGLYNGFSIEADIFWDVEEITKKG